MKNTTTNNNLKVLIFISYLFMVMMITQFQPGMVFWPDFSGARISTNFVPFIKIKEALLTIQTQGLPGGAEASRREVIKYIATVGYGFFANVVMFMPLGVMLPMLSKKFEGFIKIGLTGFFASLFIELCQLGVMTLFISSRRVFDIDDLIANTLGALAGYFIYAFFKTISRPFRHTLAHQH